MMHEPQSHIIDPNSILQQVWQGDYPNTWRIFYGSETIRNKTGTYIAYLIAAIFFFSFFTCTLLFILGAVASRESSSNQTVIGLIVLIILLLFVVLVGLAIFFTIRRIVKKRRENKILRQQPNPTLVVLPDRVVEYHRQMIRVLTFAEIAYMRLRVQANTQTVTNYTTTTNYDGTTTTTPSTSTVPAAPSIWLDLSFYNGRRDAWSLNIPPQDMIAQCILDAYNTYRVKQER